MMNVLSSILLVISLWLAALLGPQLSPWSWGASLLALGLAVAAALPGLWRQGERSVGWWLTGVGALTVGWFAVRAWLSPVAECGVMDLLLLGGAVGGYLVMRAMQESVAAERVLLWGLGLLLLASVLVTARQVVDPAFTPGFLARSTRPSGFFGHYNYGANFLIGASCLMGGAALFGSCYHRYERVLWGVTALAGIGVVYFTGSRGGQLAAAVAVAGFVVMALIAGKRRGAAWFAPGIIAVPFVGILVIAFLLKGWSRAQEMRNVGDGMEVVMDNTIRLHLIGIAVSCVTEHPWTGGGSRSFSWECNRFWEMATHGFGGNRPEQVHNEILQAATDYGIIGAGLLGLLIGSIVVVGAVKALFGERAAADSTEDAWRVGGLAGLFGILAQSNFSFVFHLVPGVLLLGLCLGRAVHPGGVIGKMPVARALGMSVLAGLSGLAVVVLLVPLGWRGVWVTAARWADGFGRVRDVAPEVRLQALNEALKWWPLEELFMARGALQQEQLAAGLQDGAGAVLLGRALADYEAAAKLNPYDPRPVVNRAYLLSTQAKDSEAEQAFELAIRLQGGLEAAYKAGFSKARHFRLKSERLLEEQQPEASLQALLAAREALEKACDFPSGAPLGQEARTLRIDLAGRLGRLFGMLGRDAEAEAEFERAAAILTGAGIRYYYADHCYGKGQRIWTERKPAEALNWFLKGRWLLGRTGPELPLGVTAAAQAELGRKLDAAIQFLKAAKVEPTEPPPK